MIPDDTFLIHGGDFQIEHFQKQSNKNRTIELGDSLLFMLLLFNFDQHATNNFAGSKNSESKLSRNVTVLFDHEKAFDSRKSILI